MKMVCISILDTATGCYSRPAFVGTVGLGIRTFGDEVTRVSPDNPMTAHPNDFQLFHLGEFDDSTGAFTNLAKPVRLAIASDFIKDK